MLPDWREAVRSVMKAAAEAENQAGEAGATLAFNYRWEHVTTVVTLALRLAELVGADREVVEAAAWLHDITKREGEGHAQSGAAFARAYLPTTDFPPEKIPRVEAAIAAHKGLWREEPLIDLETMVLWDADKLSKIGLTAAFHWTGMAFSANQPFSLADLVAKNRQTDWQEKTVASMHTEPARRAAAERLQAYKRLWLELARELAGDDLTENIVNYQHLT